MFPMRLEAGMPDGDAAAWLTPRMAARLHVVASLLAEMVDKQECHVLSSRLPHFAQPFLHDSEHPGWRTKLGRCFQHIANQLAEGQPPNPSSTGEQMVMHITIEVAEEWDSFGYFEAQGIDQELPAHPHDSDWAQARECGFESHDISVLYKLGVADPHMISLILPESSHLHPTQWFCTKRPQDFAEGVQQQPMSVMRKMPQAVKVAPPTVKQGSTDLRSLSAAVLVVPDQRNLREKEKMKEKLTLESINAGGGLSYNRRGKVRRDTL